MSLRRQHPWILRNCAARDLFWAGVVVLPAYLIQTSFTVRLGQVALFGVLAVLAGKRIQWLYFFSLVTAVTIFHLLVPAGEVVAQIGRWRITTGALRAGAFKGLTIAGMVFLSLAVVRSDLRLPGRMGSLAGKTFWSFERIMERRIEPRAGLVGIDRLLDQIYDDLINMDQSAADVRSAKALLTRSTVAGGTAIVVIVAVQWALLLTNTGL